ncbi:MAG: hypothetical protein ACLR17_13610 [Enterobacteriaceae bacterium]
MSPIVSSMTTAVRQGLIPRLFFPGFRRLFLAAGHSFSSRQRFTHRDVDDREPVLVLDETSKETLFRQ